MADRERSIEVTGADVEDAIATGLARLGVDRDAVEIEVLDEGSRGLFGLGAREARVRLVPIVEPEVEEAEPHPVSVPPAEPVAPSVVEIADAALAEPTMEREEEEAVEEKKDEVEVARGVLLELLALMGMEKVRVEVRRAEPATGEEEPPVVFDVRGPGTEALIGRRGETLAALQRITRLIAGREMTGWVRLVVDVGGFKARREKSLSRLAQRMAEQAVRTERTVVLEPMPPNERRIIHMALREHPRVTTESIGEGNRRKVTIIPR